MIKIVVQDETGTLIDVSGTPVMLASVLDMVRDQIIDREIRTMAPQVRQAAQALEPLAQAQAALGAEESRAAAEEVPGVKRRRRTKAQIEADNAAALAKTEPDAVGTAPQAAPVVPQHAAPEVPSAPAPTQPLVNPFMQ